jgi:hypothetical protein
MWLWLQAKLVQAVNRNRETACGGSLLYIIKTASVKRCMEHAEKTINDLRKLGFIMDQTESAGSSG